MRKPGRRRRDGREEGGFTLIELMVVIVISLTITGMALSTLLEVKKVQSEATVRNQMIRDAQLVMDHLGHDLNYFGVGVPEGLNAQAGVSASQAPVDQMRPAIRQAKSASMAFVGDLPYPNAELNGVTIVNSGEEGATSTGHRISVSSEISPCVPANGGADSTYAALCTPQSTSSLFASRVAGDYSGGDVCTEANGWPSPPWDATSMPATLCPWGQNKWQPPSSEIVPLVLGAPDGTWYSLQWPRGGGGGDWSDIENQLGLHLEHDWPDTGEHLLPISITNTDGAGTAFVSVIDRVFYSLESGVLKRRQCWGAIIDSSNGPGSADWPAVSDGVMDSGDDPLFCAPPEDGTVWEDVASGITAFSLRYYDLGNTEIDSSSWTPEKAAAVRVVEASIELSRTDFPREGRTISHSLTRRFFLKNWGGIAGPGVTLAQGACGDGTCGDD